MTASPTAGGRAQEAVSAIAQANGLDIRSVRPIGGYANYMFVLEPCGLVARVAGASSSIRKGDAWLAREIEVALHLERSGVRAVRPARVIPPGPHACDGLFVTFWEHVDLIASPTSPTTLGRELRLLHRTLESCSAALPTMSVLEETWSLVDRPEIAARLGPGEMALLARRSDRTRSALAATNPACQPLHGDPHHGNLWLTGEGPIWGDFEDAHTGPIEWDLACMVASSQVLGSGNAARAALEAYGRDHDSDLLNLLVVARTIQAVAWAVIIDEELVAGDRLRRRLAWLAE